MTRLAALTLATLGMLALVTPAQASVTLSFSEYSSDSTPASALTADVTFTVSGSQLTVDIANTSSYDIAELYFNADPTLSDLSFSGTAGIDYDSDWSVSGPGSYGADGMGAYDFKVDFGSGSNRLQSGTTTSFTFDMTGTTTESGIANTYSTNPPGGISAVSVLKFESGPQGDSAYGGTTTSTPPEEVPAPATLAFGLVGSVAGLIAYRRNRRSA